MAKSVAIVSPGGLSASARPVSPVRIRAGNSATVEVMLAARASMPTSISDGKVMNEPPPASAFCAPVQSRPGTRARGSSPSRVRAHETIATASDQTRHPVRFLAGRPVAAAAPLRPGPRSIAARSISVEPAAPGFAKLKPQFCAKHAGFARGGGRFPAQPANHSSEGPLRSVSIVEDALS